MSKDVCINYLEEVDTDLHLLIQSKCRRVPLDNTVEELRNPSGILYSEYEKIKKELLKQRFDHKNSLDNLFKH